MEDDDVDGYEVNIGGEPIPSYGDSKAQRAQAFQYLAAIYDGLEDVQVKSLTLQMLKALIDGVSDKPIRGLKPVE